MSRLYVASRPCEWVMPRGRSGLNRDQIDGVVLSMEYDDGLWARLRRRVSRWCDPRKDERKGKGKGHG